MKKLLTILFILLSITGYSQSPTRGALTTVDTTTFKPTIKMLAINVIDNSVVYWNLHSWSVVSTSGGGFIPIWQRTLDAGSTTDKVNNIILGDTLKFNVVNGMLILEGDDIGNLAFGTKLITDSYNKFQIQADGHIEWNNVNASPNYNGITPTAEGTLSIFGYNRTKLHLVSGGDSAIYSFGSDDTTSNAEIYYSPISAKLGIITGGYTFEVSGRFSKHQGADVSSANNLTLGTDGNTFEITGTTQINLISNTKWVNGSEITLLFTSNPTVKNGQTTSSNNITILLAGGADFIASANDVLTLILTEIGGVQAWREKSRSVN